MSGRGRGKGRGRGAKAYVDYQANDNEPDESDYSAPSAVVEDRPKKTRVVSKTIEELKRNMDIAKSRVSALIDMLEDIDNEAALKRNVATAVKHLKLIETMLDV